MDAVDPAVVERVVMAGGVVVGPSERRGATLERSADRAESSGRARDAQGGPSAGPRVTPPAPRPSAPASSRELTAGVGLPLVLMASVAVHGLLAVALAALPLARTFAASEPLIEIDMMLPAPPPEAIAPEPPPPEPAIDEPEPARPARPERVAARPPAASPQEPPPAEPPAAEPPAPAAAPPSLDEVFGEPPPPLPSLTTSGPGAFAVAAGSPDGAAGGVPGGRGRTVGAGAIGGTGTGPAAAPAGPSSEEIRRARRAYAERIRELLGRAARYPVPARRGGIQGRVVVGLRIASDGRLVGARVTSSCGFSILDEAALAAAHDLSEVPAPPPLVAWDSGDELRVPIVFELTR